MKYKKKHLMHIFVNSVLSLVTHYRTNPCISNFSTFNYQVKSTCYIYQIAHFSRNINKILINEVL